MPNWTDNQITITGGERQIAELLRVIQNEDDTISLSNINPVPDIFTNLHSGSRTIDGVKYDLWLEEEGKEPVGLDENEVSKIMKLTGATDSIDWQYKNWGTKWGDCDTQLHTKNKTKLQLKFNSAWGEPFILLDDIAKKYNLEIENVWLVEFEEGWETSNYPLSSLERMAIDNTYAAGLDASKQQIKDMFKDKEVKGHVSEVFKPLFDAIDNIVSEEE